MLPGPFKVNMPEIYQVEVTDVCNLKCVMCPRTMFKRKGDVHFIDIKLIEKLIEENAFSGSYFVEFQMAGEPLLHPKLGDIIRLVKSTGVKVGLSTNGMLIDENLFGVLDRCDYITVSVDSITNYSDIRRGGDLKRLINNINILEKYCKWSAIDLQIIELPGWEEEVKHLESLFPSINVRTVGDCFLTLTNPSGYELPVKTDICLNPWMSVSIQCNGDVVPCCFSFWSDIVYGNIKDNTLKEIWEGEKVQLLRKQHQERNYETICARCYLRSPVLLHWEIYVNSMKKGI